MNIWVYAICKNEAPRLEKWLRRMSEADGVCVLDTGSTDGSAEILRRAAADPEYRLRVEFAAYEHWRTLEEYDALRRMGAGPWRFDEARNRSLDMVPEEAELCLCVDIDEMMEPGWRRVLEDNWAPGCSRGAYKYIWNHDETGAPGIVFEADKLHSRQGYRWVCPVHEVLQAEGPERRCELPGLVVEHFADEGKSRGEYLPLLRLAARERPEDGRTLLYLGRECWFHNLRDEAESRLRAYLERPGQWRPERAYAMSILAELSQGAERLNWLYRGAFEAPEHRRCLYQLALDACRRQEWAELAALCEAMERISVRPGTYVEEPEAWGAGYHDLWALALWYTGDPGRARDEAAAALELRPGDERIRNNIALMESGGN